MLDKEKNKGQYEPYLANANVQWGYFDLCNLPQMRFEEKEQKRYELKYGDIVMCEGGEPGRCAIWRNEIPGIKIQKALHRIRITDDNTDYRYLYYWFLIAGRQSLLKGNFIETTIKHLTGERLKDIEIEFNDGHTKTLHIWMMDENDAINYVPTVYSSSAGALLLRFAHSQDIDEDSLTELESAIFTLASVNNDSTNKFYVDIDTTKENIVFPMDEMSSQLELVRSRIGDTIVYNNEYSVDMGVNSVAHISHGENDYGTIFYLPDGSFATEKNLNAIGNFFYRNGIRFAELDGKLYNIDILVYGYDDTYNLQQRIDILRQIFERGYYYTDFYEPLPNSNGD